MSVDTLGEVFSISLNTFACVMAGKGLKSDISDIAKFAKMNKVQTTRLEMNLQFFGGKGGNQAKGGSQTGKYDKASLWERLTTKKTNVNNLNPNPFDEFSNPKIGPSSSAVSKYMKEIGTTGKISEPITVQKLSSGGYEIVNGHHRWLAAIKAGLENVPIRIKNYNN